MEKLMLDETERDFRKNEGMVAYKEWLARDGFYDNDPRFENSKEFRNARLAFRRRVNGSPDTETT